MTSTPSSWRRAWCTHWLISTQVGKVLKKEYDYVKVRATFNKLTPLWDEDTQRGVDQCINQIVAARLGVAVWSLRSIQPADSFAHTTHWLITHRR